MLVSRKTKAGKARTGKPGREPRVLCARTGKKPSTVKKDKKRKRFSWCYVLG